MLEVREIYNLGITDALYDASDITRPEGCDATVGVFDAGELLGCASIKGDILVGFVISPKAQGEGLLATLCTELINRGVQNGRSTFYIFTKPETTQLFAGCGFQTIAATDHASLLEWGADSIGAYCSRLRALSADKPENAACIVMNANPFTLGHQFLAREAAARHPWLYVLVVEEDKSVFPFADRLELVRQGLAGVPNVTVMGGGKYVISQLTFPTYFIKDEDVHDAQSGMDVQLFGKYIAPALKVATRLVGEEPHCAVTASYNETMKRMLPGYGIEVTVIPRKVWAGKNQKGSVISASTVRGLIQGGNMDTVKNLVPETTYAFLRSPRGMAVTKAIMEQAHK
ncbi:[citrate (pro-3S)-lyase] ligase [Desulfovibrio sp. OttesenSCG-928-O18]|nr:[citrate (pro-3S)-lyase] ligase [Desulfovibrio sp. OttesenSCG-928-O18]